MAEFSGHVGVFRPDGQPVATWFTNKFGEETGMVFDAAGNLEITNFDASSVSALP